MEGFFDLLFSFLYYIVNYVTNKGKDIGMKEIILAVLFFIIRDI